MSQKTKTIILITIILIATVIIGVYFFQKNRPAFSTPQTITLPQAIQQPTATTENEQAAKPVTPIQQSEIKGKVVGMTSKSIIIDRSEGAIEIGITIDTPVTSAQGKGSIVDIKAGTNVIAQIDPTTKEAKVISVEK